MHLYSKPRIWIVNLHNSQLSNTIQWSRLNAKLTTTWPQTLKVSGPITDTSNSSYNSGCWVGSHIIISSVKVEVEMQSCKRWKWRFYFSSCVHLGPYVYNNWAWKWGSHFQQIVQSYCNMCLYGVSLNYKSCHILLKHRCLHKTSVWLIPLRYVSLMWSLFLVRHIYWSRIWQGLY